MWQIFWWIKTQLCYRFFFRRCGIKSYIGSIIFLYNGNKIKLGNKVRIFPGCRMECHDNGEIVISDDISIGQNFHITSGGGLHLCIGPHTTILGNTFITNIDHEYKKLGEHILSQPHLCKNTFIGENCFIGYGVAIQAGTVLGKQCIVGANSVVRGIFPDYSVIVGVPARVVKRYNFSTRRWERTNPDGSFIEIK